MCDSYKNYIDELRLQAKEKWRSYITFPFILDILPKCIYNTKDPIIIGVEVKQGRLKTGAIICTKNIEIGIIESIENNHIPLSEAKEGQQVCIKIRSSNNITFGRQLNISDNLYSKITRESIDLMKLYFRDELIDDDWKIIIKLKDIFNIN